MMVDIHIGIDGSILRAEFNPSNGIFVGECNFPGADFNAYSIRSKDFSRFDGTTYYPTGVKNAVNHDELVELVKEYYLDFKF
jgi:hypothetical protein